MNPIRPFKISALKSRDEPKMSKKTKRQKRGLPEGKLPIEALGPMLEEIPTNGLLVKSRMGMDAGIVELEGSEGKVISLSAVLNKDVNPRKTEKLVSDLSSKIVEAGFRPIAINPVLLFPVGTSMPRVRHIVLAVSKIAKKKSITVGKGHTEITRVVPETILIVTIFGSR